MQYSKAEIMDVTNGRRGAEISGSKREIILSVRNVNVSFGDKEILHNLDLDVFSGEILGFVGASGSGKSVLMRAILGLNKRQSGTIKLFGVEYAEASDEERFLLDQHIGVMFQHGALFSSLSVLDNICLLYTSP